MSASSSRTEIEPDDNNSIACQSVANYETNWDDRDLVNWQLPNIQQYSIYRKSRTLDFRSILGQKTKEINVKFHNNTFSTNLLNKNSLNHYHKIGYSDLHIGSVQIGLKPLAKIGLNNSILVVLRDKRITNYKESILGIAETSLTYGPIYFQCYPNFTIALNSDEHKEKCLAIDIQTHNYQFLRGSSPYKLIYRIHYRVLTTGLIPSYIPPVVPAGQTICYNACPIVNLMVPTPVRWEDINFPENWLKEYADRPTYRIPMRDLRDCISDLDGTLRISFRDRSLSSREPSLQIPRSLSSREPPLQIPNYDDDLQSARNSLSSLSRLNIRNQIPSLVEQYQYQPNPNTRNQLPSLENRYKPGTSESSEPINLIPRQRRQPIPTTIEIPEIPTHISKVHKTPEQVALPIHTYDQEGPSSPTPSQVLTEIPDTEPQIRTINVLDTNHINYEILIAEYLSHKSRTKYESSYSQKKQDQFRLRWLQNIETLNKSIPFFEWYANRKSIENDCQCLVMDRSTFRTYKTKKGEETLPHPPPRTCEIEIENEDREVPGGASKIMTCSPYILIDSSLSNTVPASSQQMGIIMKQNNYTNAYLKTVGDQLDRIEISQYQSLTRSVPESVSQDPQSSYQPGVLLFPDTTGIEKCFDNHNLLDTEELLKLVEERLSQIP
ncbi:hypothetical protein LWI29_023362 [Acer saccharum]|uniref:DUF7588 domain-containing protein n=1 Tax=Acer saccharum TaxID=4024 RepID=A0AA39S4B8_ACESA|nr:hypothetical protein LWI29_023362 [Acer saccharum]